MAFRAILAVAALILMGASVTQAQAQTRLYWSSAGPIGGLFCTQVIEGASPPEHTWRDNYLCADRDIGLRWSSSGPIAGMTCTQIIEGAEPAAYTWRDNYLCLPQGSPITLRWSSAGALAGLPCVQVHEGRDPYTWHDNFLCYTEAFETADLLTITKIKTVKPAGGLDAAGKFAFGLLGGAIQVGADNFTGGTVTVGALIEGGQSGVRAAEYLDGHFSGQDDLIVKVDGRTVLPTSGSYYAMQGGQVIHPNIQAAFRGAARISLIEYDSGSDNDDLGGLIVAGGHNYTVNDAIVIAPAEEDGSIYLVSYRVDAGRGNPPALVRSVLCGTNQCDECYSFDCSGQPYGELDRDGDLEDLKACPPAFATANFQKHPQVIVEDVYLRVCQRR